MKQNLFKMITVLLVMAVFLIGCKMLQNKSVFAKLKELSLEKGIGTPKLGSEKIKGKIAIIKVDLNAVDALKFAMDRFSEKGVFDSGNVEKSKNFFPPEIYAQNIDELSTLIIFDRDKEVFQVSIIDYKTKEAIANFEYAGTKNDKGFEYIGKKAEDKETVLLERVGDYMRSLPNELSPAYFEKPIGETVSAKDLLDTKYSTSTDILDKYRDKEIVVTGYSLITTKTDSYLRSITPAVGPSSGASINCWSGKIESQRFNTLKDVEYHKLTVIGNLKTIGSTGFDIVNCRLIKGEVAER